MPYSRYCSRGQSACSSFGEPAQHHLVHEVDEGAHRLVDLLFTVGAAQGPLEATHLGQQKLLELGEALEAHPDLGALLARGGLGGQGLIQQRAHLPVRPKDALPMLEFHEDTLNWKGPAPATVGRSTTEASAFHASRSCCTCSRKQATRGSALASKGSSTSS